MEKITKKYIVCEKTLKEAMNIACNSTQYGRISVYNYVVPRDDMNEEQRAIQRNNNYYTCHTVEIRYDEYRFKELINEMMYKEILGGRKEKLFETVYDKIMNTKIRVLAEFQENKEECITRLRTDNEIEGEEQKDYEYSRDLKEFEQRLSEVSKNAGYTDKVEVRLEEFDVGIYQYAFNDADKNIKKIINKFIKDNLTYCIKQGKIIIPEEYLAKGKEGIEEWRNIKRSNNKNNNMEKQLLRQTYADKKKFMFRCMSSVIDTVCKNSTWDVPCLYIDGRWNKGKITKLSNKLLKDKTKQEIMDMPKEEISEAYKDYWKDILMTAYNNVDKLELKDEYYER